MTQFVRLLGCGALVACIVGAVTEARALTCPSYCPTLNKIFLSAELNEKARTQYVTGNANSGYPSSSHGEGTAIYSADFTARQAIDLMVAPASLCPIVLSYTFNGDLLAADEATSSATASVEASLVLPSGTIVLDVQERNWAAPPSNVIRETVALDLSDAFSESLSGGAVVIIGSFEAEAQANGQNSNDYGSASVGLSWGPVLSYCSLL